MGRRLAVKDETTRESAGHADPFKHELTYGIGCRHIQIHGPPSPYASDRVFDDLAEECHRKMYHTPRATFPDCQNNNHRSMLSQGISKCQNNLKQKETTSTGAEPLQPVRRRRQTWRRRGREQGRRRGSRGEGEEVRQRLDWI